MTTLHTNFTITHLATGYSSSAPVQVSMYEQNVSPNFSSTQVYARMDPIFTYQNTVRTFSVTCETLLKKEYMVFEGLDAKLGNEPSTEKLTEVYSGFIQDIYKFMYPVYENQGGDFSTKILKGPPILKLKIDKVLTFQKLDAQDDATEGIIFVPEQFSLVRGLANKENFNFTVGAGEFPYIANKGGYAFTLGGTILHKDEPPGFIHTPGQDGSAATIEFSKKNFPLGSPKTGIKKLILAENSDGS